MKSTKLISVILTAILLIAAFAACQPAQEAEIEPIDIMVLNGTTGFGMAKLISDNTSGAAAYPYNITVETDASNITAALISGTSAVLEVKARVVCSICRENWVLSRRNWMIRMPLE